MILTTDRLDRLISRARLFMLAGGVAIIVHRFMEVGAVSAGTLIGLGALLRCVEKYKSETGLWMLALLFGCLLFISCCLFVIMDIVDAIRGAQQPSWQVALDVGIAIRFEWLMVRAMWSVVVHNRQLTNRKGKSCQEPLSDDPGHEKGNNIA